MKKALIISIACNVLFVTSFTVKKLYVNKSVNDDFYDLCNSNKNGIFNKLNIDTSAIVFVGTSLTEGFMLNEFLDSRIINRGIGFNKTDHIVNRIGKIAAFHPRKIFLEAGINDLTSNVPTGRILENYKRIIDTVLRKSPRTIVYFQSVLPISEQGNRNDTIIAVNKTLQAICNSKGVQYIDLHKFFYDGAMKKEYTTDGVHLTGEGYLKWAQIVKSYL